MITDLNIYTIPEQYRPTWEASLLAAITQPSVHLEQYAKRLTNCTGEYVKIQTRGTTTLDRRKQRHEKVIFEELLLGQRRLFPVSFAKALGMSKDDEIFKGGLPITLQTLHEALNEAAAPQTDRSFLGVVYDDEKENCIIAPEGTELSPYLNDGSDGINTVVHNGHFGGIMGTMYGGSDGMTKIPLAMHPFIGDALATNWTDYKDNLDNLVLKKSNVIPVNYVKDGTPVAGGLTIEKLRAARLGLVKRHAINSNEEVCMAITPQQLEDLLTAEKMINKDFGFGTLGETGLNKFLNIRFLVTVDVPIVDIGGMWVRACPMWVRRDVAFGIWKNVEFSIDEWKDHWDTVVAKMQFSYGAGRLREESMMIIHCAEPELAALSA